MLKEFKEFAMRGNVLDMAIGIVIGAAFGRIVSSFVADILMPPIGLLLGGVDFSNIFVTLSGGEYASLEEAKAAGAATIGSAPGRERGSQYVSVSVGATTLKNTQTPHTE